MDNYKLNSADDIQKEYLEKEYAATKGSKASLLITIIAFALIILGISIAYLIVPDKAISENENRALQEFPEASIETIFNGGPKSFSSKFSSYMSDQFPFRETAIEIKAFSEIAQLKGENGNVILTKDYLITKMDNPSYKYIVDNVNGINSFVSNLDIPYKVVIAPRLADVASSILPASYPKDALTNLQKEIDDYLTIDNSGNYVDLTYTLKGKFDNGEYVYYRTDHHWTTLGAYYAYKEIMSSWCTPKDLSHYKVEVASDSFYGTTWSSSGMRWVKPDTINYFRFDGDDTNYKVRIYSNITTNEYTERIGLYDRSYLDKKDKYSSFIYENAARIDIVDTVNTDKETILVIRDSFASSLVPFIAEDYNLIIIDSRYYNLKPVSSILDEEKVDKVIILYNIDTLTTTSAAALLPISK